MQAFSKQRWIQGLNPRQAEAVCFHPGGIPDGDEAAHASDENGAREPESRPGSPALLVLAGAGSGKTTVLTRRVAFLMDGPARKEGILALTFTKDAAVEMESRLRKLLSEKTGSVDFPYIGTFHAFAFKLLRSDFRGEPNWRRLGFSRCPELIDPAARLAWLAAVKKDMALQEPMDVLEEWIASPYREEGNRGPVPASAARAAELRRRFREHGLATGAVGFDDMVALADRLLARNPGLLSHVRSRFGHILVDEFQDTSGDQLGLVKSLAGQARSLFLVGDDDQAIYGFRGADPGNIAAVLACFPGMRVLKLETNYRSSPAIIAYANAVFRGKPEQLRKRLEAGSDRGSAPVRAIVHGDGPEQARWIIGEMRRLRGECGLAWSDMALLFRINALEPYYRSMLARLAGAEAARDVILATVHAAKGLEYPAVFFVGLEDGILPLRRRGEKIAPERLAEERRVFYVGVTRAQRHLYLCACRRRVLRGKHVEAEVSPFLREPRAWRRKEGKP